MANNPPFIVREGKLLSAAALGTLSGAANHDSPISDFLSPHRVKYPSDYRRGWIQRLTKRMFSPYNHVLVASPVDDPGKIVGYVQYEDIYPSPRTSGFSLQSLQASTFIQLARTIILYIGLLIYTLYCSVLGYFLGPDRSANITAVNIFQTHGQKLETQYWSPTTHPLRARRYYVQSVAVATEYQRRGIAGLLMKEVLRRAEGEESVGVDGEKRKGVLVGLVSSPQGERLYRKLGFELLGRFEENLTDEGDTGGIFMWTPPAWKDKTA